MKIGLYDPNVPSGLSAMVRWAREDKGHELFLYDSLPQNSTSIPPIFIINPGAGTDVGGWEKIKQCIGTNRFTEFLLVTPNLVREYGIDHAKQVLAGLGNVTYFGPGDAKKLYALLEQNAGLVGLLNKQTVSATPSS